MFYFSSPDSGLAVGDANGGTFEVYTTSDGGATWGPRVAGLPSAYLNEAASSYEFTYSKDSFYFVTVFTTGVNLHQLYKTGDGGHTWDTTLLSTNNLYDYVNLQTNNGGKYISENIGGIYPSNMGYYYSNDYGATTSLLSS